MLVFRCECEHVLGVDGENNAGGVGECPSCGRIIRVPPVLVNANGRLRLVGTPSRATPSGAYRQIKDIKPDSAKSGPLPISNFKNTNGAPAVQAPPPAVSANPDNDASTMIDTKGLAASVALAGKNADVEILPENAGEIIPANDHAGELKEPGALTATGMSALDSVPDVPEVASPAKSPLSPPPPKNAKKPFKPMSQRSPGKDKSVNDPAAATETRIDKNIAAVANAAASSKRRKAEAAPDAAPKKSNMLIFIIIGLVLVLGGLTAFALGVFDKKEEVKETKTPATAPAAPLTKPTDKPATPETKTETPPGETKTEPKKEEPKADSATPKDAAPAETKPEEKKTDAVKTDDAQAK